MKTLNGKVAIVTGGGSGIGREVAELYASEGAKIVISDVDEKGANETVEAIKAAGGEAIFVKADTAKAEDSKKVVDEAVKHFGLQQMVRTVEFCFRIFQSSCETEPV